MIYPKLYLWNENAFKAFEVQFTLDLNQEINRGGKQLGSGVNLLDSVFLSRDLTRLQKYKQIRNMDFTNYEVRNVVEVDKLLVWNKPEKKYFVMMIDSGLASQEEIYFNNASSLQTKYDVEFAEKDDVMLMPLDPNAQKKDCVSDMSLYLAMVHTTSNDLVLQYSMGHGKLPVNDYRVKEFRIERVHHLPEAVAEPEFESPLKRNKVALVSQTNHFDLG